MKQPTLPMNFRAAVIAATLCGCTCGAAIADETNSVAEPEESEVTGFEFADRLVVRPVLEYEWFNDRLRTRNGLRFRESDVEGTFDLGFEIQLAESIDTLLNFTYDIGEAHGYLDEYSIGWSSDRASLTAGLQSLPVAETDSYFISDPLTRFADIDSESLVFEYELSDRWSIATGIYAGPSESEADRDGAIDGVALIEMQLNESMWFGFGIMSDLTDGDDVLDLDDPAPRDSRTPGFGVTARWSAEVVEVSAELMRASRDIPDVSDNVNRPRAWAIQATWLPQSNVDIALRAEGSSELFNAPRRNYGIAATWRFHPNMTLAFELMRGQYAKEFVFDDDDNGFDTNRRGALQLTVRF